ncbi:MAG TPA: hypothetical protein VFS60_16640 [Thermoanaerobaculia bacterium]|nr:hypothetical protein [Thermoanaerobaculia bacterium]
MRPPSAANPRPQGIPRLVAALAALLLAPAAAGAANYWVGNAGVAPCTHATLQAAIDTAVGGAGDDVISLVGPGPFNGPFTIFGGGIHIRGNVGSCGSNASVGYATIRAPSGSRPLTILMGGAETVRLQRVIVTTDNGAVNGDGGAIWFAGASNDSWLDLIDSQVVANTALGDGGGIYVSGGKLWVSLLALVGANNAAGNGGGIAAKNGALVEVRGGFVLGNVALFDGGGIYAPDAAVNMLTGGVAASVSNNIAGRDGGGLYLGGGHVDVLTAPPDFAPSLVSGNQAQRGGGLFVDGADVRLRYVSVEHNTAGGEGGGVYVTDGGGVFTNASAEAAPRNGFPRLEANVAADGAALYAADGAVILTTGSIRGHQGTGAAAMAVAAGDTSFLLTGVSVQSNAMPALFGIEGSAIVQLWHDSLAGNDVTGIVRWRGSSSILYVIASVLDETEPFFASFQAPSNPPQFSCVVSRYASPFATVPPGTIFADMVFADPQFVAPPGDLHLRHGSPAIDLCVANPQTDHDGDARSYDDRYHPNGELRTADAGADETTVLFADGAESGTLAAWNGASP